MGKHDREKDDGGQVPPDKPVPKGDWVQRDDDKRDDKDK